MSVTLNYEISYTNPKIVFVSGGPGSGKGTQCERLVRDYHFEHISVGDVVRDEIHRGTPEGEKFKELAARGDLVPDNLVVNLIIKTIKARRSEKYLIDGFPRGVDQAKLFEKKYKEIDYILNFDVPDSVLLDRLLSRGKTSGRADDNAEAIQNRLDVFHEKTQPVLDFYNHFGKVKTIDGTKSVDDVYRLTQEAIKPNVIFMFGPPTVGKTECARRLCEKVKYSFVHIEAFDKQYGVKNETDRINKLIDYLQTAPFNNFIIDSFFSTKATAEIFLTHFTAPLKVFNFESPKDEVMHNIDRFIPTEKEQLAKQKAYNTFITTRSEVLSLVSKMPYFQTINAVDTLPNIVRTMLNSIRPLVISAFTYNNMDLGLQYCDELEKKRNFIFIDVSEQSQNEIDRGTSLGAKMNAFEQSGQEIPAKFSVELLQKLLFANPAQRRFVLTRFPERNAQFELFERELFPIDYLMNFYTPSQQVKYYHDQAPLLKFYARGRYIHIDRDALDIVDAHINDRTNYGFVLGPVASGKTALSKYISTKFGYTLVEWEPTIEMLKTKLGSEDGPLEEVTYEQVEKYFADLLHPSKNPPQTLFDGWPQTYTQAQFSQFLKKVGQPQFLVDLTVKKEVLLRRFRIKSESDPEAEATEEDLQKIDELLANAQSYTNELNAEAEKNFGFTLYRLDVNASLETTCRFVNNIFYKRVFVVNDYTTNAPEERREEQRLLFLNLCARTNCTFIDVNEVLKTQYWQKTQPLHENLQSEFAMLSDSTNPTFASNYSPKVIIAAIQNHLKSLRIPTRDILLYGYPAGDTPNEQQAENRFYPRASDEIQNLERNLGPVRIVCVLTDNRVEWAISDQPQQLEPPAEKPKKKVGEDGEEEEEAPEEPEEEEEEGKVKFNVYDYQWTNTNGLPKSLPQWFNKLKTTQKKHYSVKQNGTENAYERFLEYLRLVDEENAQNKSDKEHLKINLFIQLRYDDVAEHEENEAEPQKNLYKHIIPEEPKLVLPDKDIEEVVLPPAEENGEEEEEDD